MRGGRCVCWGRVETTVKRSIESLNIHHNRRRRSASTQKVTSSRSSKENHLSKGRGTILRDAVEAEKLKHVLKKFRLGEEKK